MVKLYPESVEGTGNSQAELLLRKLFLTLSDDWYVWHSKEWVSINRERSELGEADFVVAKKGLGFLVLEVKGGGIRIENEKWFTRNNSGEYSIKDPFRQARRNMYALRDYYTRKARSASLGDVLSSTGWFPGKYFYGVLFPQSDFKSRLPLTGVLEFDEDQVFDKSDLLNQQEWMDSGMSGPSPLEDYLIKLFNTISKSNFFFSKECLTYFTTILSPTINLEFQIEAWMKDREEKLIDLDKDQDMLLRMFSEKRKCVFQGSAGTGKSYIAVKKIIKEVKKGKDVLFLCYNRGLKEFIKYLLKTRFMEQLKEIRIQRGREPRITVKTIDGLAKYLGVDVTKSVTKKKFNDLKIKEKAELIQKALKQKVVQNNFKRAVLIVDEAQDFEIPYLEVLPDFLKDKESLFWLFYDQDQLIFQDQFNIEDIGFSKECDRFFLTDNIRNVDEIVTWITEVSQLGNYSGRRILGGKEVTTQKAKNLLEALEQAHNYIERFVCRDDVKPDEIVVLCDKKFEYLDQNVYSISSENAHFLYRNSDGVNLIEPTILKPPFLQGIELNEINVLFTGIGGYKGLESNMILLIIEENALNNIEKRRRLYVGASRAKFYLKIIFYKGE